MRTETELREALSSMADQAPATARIRDGLVYPPYPTVQPVIRRRLTLVLVLGVLMVVLAMALPVFLARRDATPVDTRATGNWNQIHRVELPTGWTITARNVDPTVESTSLSGPGDVGCLVQVWGAGQNPRLPANTQPVTVQGGPGLYGNLDPDDNTVRSGVFWRYWADAWATVGCDLPKAHLLAMAERVRLGVQPDATALRLAEFPEDYAVVALIEYAAPYGLAGNVQLARSDGDDAISLDIGNTDPTDQVEPGEPVERLQVNGRPVEIRSRSQHLCWLGTGSQQVCLGARGREPGSDFPASGRELALDLAHGVTPVKDPSRLDTWSDANDALPS